MFQVYDLEVLRNYFLYVGLSLEKEKFYIFEISRFNNDLEPLINHLKTLGGQIGFNNLNYDSQIQEYILRTYKKWKNLSGEEISEAIYKYSQKVIERKDGEWPDYREKDLSIRQLDLFRIWHYNNKARSCSLKWLQYSMDWDNIEDMPIHHYSLIEDKKTAKSIVSYCKNDCLSTKVFYNTTLGLTEHPLYKGIDKIQLRKDIREEFKINCMNFDDVKIGDNIIKSIYSRISKIDIFDIPKKGTSREIIRIKDCIDINIQFESEELKEVYNKFLETEFDPHFIKDYKNHVFTFKGLKITIGLGGLHTLDKPRIVNSNKFEYLSDKDCTGMYPKTIIERKLYPEHLGPAWYEGCKYIYDKRTNEYKPQSKKSKKAQSFSEAFKLSSNGGSFGKTNEPNSWQYDPLVTFNITVYNQIALLKLVESFLLNGIKVISINTDGVLSLVDVKQKDLYELLCKEWEQLTHHQLEETLYSKFIQLSVNDYIAIKTDGESKLKGSFLVDYELHKNKSFKVIPMALEAYYKNGLNPANFVRSHNNIFDFCAGIRAKGDWWFEERSIIDGKFITKKLQKTVRHYISNNGCKLMKCNIDGRELQVNAGKYLSTVYNKHKQLNISEYDINYEFYIDKVYDVIHKIEPDVINKNFTQLSLF